MYRVLIAVLLFVAFNIEAQITIEDEGLRSCFNDDYPTLLLNDSTLNSNVANVYTQKISCKDYVITDISALSSFGSIWGLELENVMTSELLPLLDLTSLEQLIIKDSDLGSSLPELSTLTKLNFLSITNSQLKEFPQLPPMIDVIQLDDNDIQTVQLNKSYPELFSIQLVNCNLTSINGLANAPQLHTVLLGDNNLSEIEDLSSLVNLEVLQLFSNELSVLHGIEKALKLKRLHISGNNFADIPNVNINTIEKLHIGYNDLTFEDLLSINTSSYFPDSFPSYNYQNTQGKREVIKLNEGEYWSYKLDFDESVTSNYYLWYRNDVLIDSTENSAFIIESILATQEGEYTCVAKNTILPNVVIKNKPITIEVVTSVSETESSAFSPNNDGVNDTYYIEKAGIVKVFTERGQLVKEFQAPGYWDGTDESGTPLPFGYYILSIDEHTRFGVTIVK